MQKRSFTISGVRTSIALEPEFWAALATLTSGRADNLTALVTKLDSGREPTDSLASTLRVFALLNRAA